MALYAVVPALAAMTAAATVYLGDNLKSTQIEAQLPSEISKIIPENLKSKSIPTEQLSIKDVDTNLRIDSQEPTETTEQPAQLSEPSETTKPTESVEQLPQPAESVEPTEKPVEPTEPVESTEPVTPSSPKSETEQENTIKGGLRLGRPPWGEITSNVKKDEVGVTGTNVSSNSWLSLNSQVIDPVQLQINLRKIRDLIIKKKADISLYEYNLTKKNNEKKKLLDEFSSINSEKIIADILEKKANRRLKILEDINQDPLITDLKSRINKLEQSGKKNSQQGQQGQQGQQSQQGQVKGGAGENAEKISELYEKINKRRDELESEIENSEKRNKIMLEYKNAWLRKEELDSSFLKLKEKRDKELENEKNDVMKLETLKKELKELKIQEETFLQELLKLKQKPKTEATLVLDFDKRREDYYNAKDAYEAASTRYTNYLALEIRKPEVLERFEKEKEYAAKELDRTIVLLTEIRSKETFAGLEFSKFKRDIEETIGSAIVNTPVWAKESGNTKFLNAFQIFLNRLKNPAFSEIANIYYLTEKQEDIIANLERYINFFKPKADFFNRNTENSINSEIFNSFEEEMLTAYTSIRLLEMDTNINKAPATNDMYKEIRKIALPFFDKQIYSINNFLDLVKVTLINSKYEGSSQISKLKDLYKYVNLIMHRIIPPASGTKCQELLPTEVYNLFKSGVFGKEKINGKDVDLKISKLFSDLTKFQEKRQDFLNKINFLQIENFEQLLSYYQQNLKVGIQPENVKRIRLFKKALLAKIAKEGRLDNIDLIYDDSFMPNPTATQLRIRTTATNAGGVNLEQFYDIDFNPSTNGVGTQLKNIKFDYGNFMKTKNGIESIENIYNACEVDGNMGEGVLTNANLKEILEKLKNFGQEKAVKTGLDLFIEQETKSGRINRQRNTPFVTIKTLFDIGFSPQGDYDIFSICKTSDKYSIIYAFLQCKSRQFSSIPYDSQTIFNNIRQNSREIFVELFAQELKKTSPFRSNNKNDDDILKDFKDFKDSEKETTIIKGLALQFNIKIILFENSPKLKINEIKPPDTDGTDVIYMFRDKQNIYYPIVLQNPPLTGQRENDKYDLSRFMGGAIDGPELIFKEPEIQNAYIQKRLKDTSSKENQEVQRKQKIEAEELQQKQKIEAEKRELERINNLEKEQEYAKERKRIRAGPPGYSSPPLNIENPKTQEVLEQVKTIKRNELARREEERGEKEAEEKEVERKNKDLLTNITNMQKTKELKEEANKQQQLKNIQRITNLEKEQEYAKERKRISAGPPGYSTSSLNRENPKTQKVLEQAETLKRNELVRKQKEAEEKVAEEKAKKQRKQAEKESAKLAIKKQAELEANKQKQIKQALARLPEQDARRIRTTAKNQEEMNKGLAGKGRKTRRNLRLR